MKRLGIRFGRPKTKKNTTTDNTPIVLEIESLGHDGRGVGRHQGKTLFVEGALPHEQVHVDIIATHKRFDEAKVSEIITPCADRVDPFCKYYDDCGGCQLQHLEHSVQIHHKQKSVLSQLQRIGQITPEVIETPLTSPSVHYRRSARVGINVLQRSGEVIVGFRRQKSNKLLDIDHCPILDQRCDGLFSALKATLQDLHNPKGFTHAEILLGDQSIAMQIRCKHTPDKDSRELLETFAKTHQLNLYIKTDTQLLTLCEASTKNAYQVAGNKVELLFEPGDFLQVNASINQKMIDQAIDWLAPTPQDSILDLFCGLGNFTLPLAHYADHVTGIEGSDEMVSRANKNALFNQLANVSFYRADLAGDNQQQAWYQANYNKMLLDPPRSGAYELIDKMPLGMEKILYISCEPSALARDTKRLQEKGYKLTRFCAMDMFPHTSHVESMALFEKAEKPKIKPKAGLFKR